MAVSDLTAVLPPPPGHGWEDVDWAAAERSLGLSLPQDYKDFIALYGPGTFDDFLHVFLPATGNENLDLGHRQRMDIDTLRDFKEEFPENVPYRLTGPVELVPAAITINGDIVYWRRQDVGSPDSWTMAICESRISEWFEYDGSLTSFLADLLTRRVRVPLFPEGIPHSPPEYFPYEP